jgi:Ca2+-transporting ATPase
MKTQAIEDAAAGISPAWHSLTIAEAAARLRTSPDGLASEEARRRLGEAGPNELLAAPPVSPWSLLAAQFRNVLIVILLVATALSAFLGHTVEAIAITVIVLFAVLLGFVQEYRAERAIEALRRMAAPGARVLRDGVEAEVPAREVVPGDVLLLATGDRIAADARLIEAVNLQVQEAALTGESVPVEKRSEALDSADLAIGDRRNMVYAGTAATYGRGRAMVVATGMASEFGRIAGMLETVETGRTASFPSKASASSWRPSTIIRCTSRCATCCARPRSPPTRRSSGARRRTAGRSAVTRPRPRWWWPPPRPACTSPSSSSASRAATRFRSPPRRNG